MSPKHSPLQNQHVGFAVTHPTTRSRCPMFLAALIFSFGLWTGVRMWRPPVWWMIAILAFALAIAWFISRRAWLARSLAFGLWFLFGVFLIQIRGGPTTDPRLPELADGREVTLTAHVIREGYAHAAGGRSIRQGMDIETEQIESDGKVWPIHAGIRMSLYEQPEKAAAPALAPTAGIDVNDGRINDCWVDGRRIRGFGSRRKSDWNV